MAWSQAWIAASPLSLAQSCSASANAAPDDPINKYERTAKYALNMASAHFPKFVIHRSTHLHELRKAKGTSKLTDASAAFLFEVPGSNSPLVMQELQIGGTNPSTCALPDGVSRARPSPNPARSKSSPTQ